MSRGERAQMVDLLTSGWSRRLSDEVVGELEAVDDQRCVVGACY